MARRSLLVGDEEGIRLEMRNVLAHHVATHGAKVPFSVNLMDFTHFVGLNDKAREKIIGILDGYVGASITWQGVTLPKYRYSRLTCAGYHIGITFF